MNLRDHFLKDVKGFPPSESNELISQPFSEGLCNSVIALVVGAMGALGGGVAHHWYPFPLSSWFVSIAGLTAFVVVFFCFGHAYLGSHIGRRKATNVVKAIVYSCLIIGCIIVLVTLP